jgi:hypothetical protein
MFGSASIVIAMRNIQRSCATNGKRMMTTRA